MYSESKEKFDSIPNWVSNLIAFGYHWKNSTKTGKRRIGIVSMPCESHAAALISLGAIRKDLEDKNANNIQGHFQYLIRTRDSLTNEERNKCIVIDDTGHKWKFSNEKEPDKIALIQANYSEYIKRKGRQIPNPNGPVSRIITQAKADSFRLENEPLIEVSDDGKKLLKEDYISVPQCSGEILEENLERSYSGVLFIGKASGKDSNYVKTLYDIHFENNDCFTSLGHLLTLHYSQQTPISRISFCNIEKISDQSQEHYLVITDGAHALYRALEHFKQSDLIGVCSRDESEDNIENLINQVSSKERHYIEDSNSHLLEYSSKSISIRILEKR